VFKPAYLGFVKGMVFESYNSVSIRVKGGTGVGSSSFNRYPNKINTKEMTLVFTGWLLV